MVRWEEIRMLCGFKMAEYSWPRGFFFNGSSETKSRSVKTPKRTNKAKDQLLFSIDTPEVN